LNIGQKNCDKHEHEKLLQFKIFSSSTLSWEFISQITKT
jgi:hypothetical protein